MKVTKRLDGTCLVDACFNHYGHRRDLRHIWISRKKRQEIAGKLQQGVTKEKILQDIRESVGVQFYRDHLIDKQDMANISRSYALDEIERHPNDMLSVLAWISEWEKDDANPVLYYKLQGKTFLSLSSLNITTVNGMQIGTPSLNLFESHYISSMQSWLSLVFLLT